MERAWVAAFLVLALTVACGAQVPAATPMVQPPAQQRGSCGDGVCDGPESESTCPADCAAQSASRQQPQGSQPTMEATAQAAAPTVATSGKIPPLYFIYVVHTHVSDGHLPYTSPARDAIDAAAADNMLAAIEGIAGVLDAHGVPGTWEVTAATASGLCSYQGEDHVFAQLLAAGHEIATHGHSTRGLRESYLALQADCGITAATASGFMAEAARAGSAGAQEAMASVIEAALDLGMRVATENLSPADLLSPFGELCNNQIGRGNDMWAQTGNLMFPWRPDCGGGEICADHPRCEVVFVVHVSITWTMPGEGSPPADILSDADSSRLEVYLQSALDHMASNLPETTAVWGFATHIIEYSPGGDAQSPPVAKSLDALDRSLAWVDAQQATGRVIYVTASEAAGLAFP